MIERLIDASIDADLLKNQLPKISYETVLHSKGKTRCFSNLQICFLQI